MKFFAIAALLATTAFALPAAPALKARGTTDILAKIDVVLDQIYLEANVSLAGLHLDLDVEIALNSTLAVVLGDAAHNAGALIQIGGGSSSTGSSSSGSGALVDISVSSGSSSSSKGGNSGLDLDLNLDVVGLKADLDITLGSLNVAADIQVKILAIIEHCFSLLQAKLKVVL